MWTQIVYEEKTDRVHPRGPLFPHHLVSHSSTHWITRRALLDMIDAIDADMHARAGDAEQRNFTAYTQPLDRAHMRAFKSSIRSEVAKHFAEFFLEAKSNFERANLDSTTSVLRQLLLSFARTQQHRTQTARNIELLAGASSIGTRWSSVSFLQKQNAFWRRENCFHEAQPRSRTHQMPRPKPPTGARGARDGDHSSDSDDAPTGVEESAAPAAPAVAAAPE